MDQEKIKSVELKGDTTIKVSQKVVRHIQSKAIGNEAVDTTLRRLLGLPVKEEEPAKRSSGLSILKISRPVMEKIAREAKKGESRDETLVRLLGLKKGGGK